MTTRDDLYQLSLKALDDFQRSGTARQYLVRATSGTSSQGPLVAAVFVEPRASDRYRNARRPLICFGSYAAQLSNVLFFYNGPGDPPREALVLATADIAPSLERLLVEFQPDAIVGVPSLIIRVLQNIYNGAILSPVREVLMTGEYLTDVAERYIASRLPHARRGMIYAATEIGGISAFPCGFLLRNTYHPHESVTVKIIDADEEGFGDIIISTRISPSVYVEDYHIGDIGRWSTGICPCGNPTTLEVAGRSGFDYIKLEGAVFRQEEFERVAEELKEYVEDFRAELKSEFDERAFRGRVHLRIMPRPTLRQKSNPEEFLAEEFSKRLFISAGKNLEYFIRKGDFLPAIVSLVPTPFPAANKGIKLFHLKQ